MAIFFCIEKGQIFRGNLGANFSNFLKYYPIFFFSIFYTSLYFLLYFNAYKHYQTSIRIISNLGYIDGIDFIPILGSDIPDFKLIGCHLTISGMIYLEDNTTMKNAYKLLKEAKEWIPGL